MGSIRQAILAAWFACCIATLVGAAMAQESPPPEAMIQKQDKDGDGLISREEWLGPPENFDKIDQDHDGFLSLAELKNRQQAGAPAKAGDGQQAQGSPPPETMIQKQDKDGDGLISREEWLGPPENFDNIDRDHDGFLSLADLKSRKQAGAPGKPGDGQPGINAGIKGCKQACVKNYGCGKSFGLEVLGYIPSRKQCGRKVKACQNSCDS